MNQTPTSFSTAMSEGCITPPIFTTNLASPTASSHVSHDANVVDELRILIDSAQTNHEAPCCETENFISDLFSDADYANLKANAVPSNYVARRDFAGRPIVWRIGGMTRKISYLANGKIETFQDLNKLPPLAGSNGMTVYMLGFETYDSGRTYIGQIKFLQEIDSLVMTDLYLKNDGTVVASDDSGLKMTWNPNNGDTSIEFTGRNHKIETSVYHLDGTVTSD